MSIEDIRARCGASVTEMVSGPKEYGQSQQIIRDRAELLTAYDALRSQNTALIQQMGASVETERQLRERIGELEAALERYAQNPPWDRATQLEAALREAKLQCGTWKRIAESGLGLTPETPPHLRGPIIQAHADTNGVPPSSETPDPSARTGPYTGDYADLPGDRATSENREEHGR